MISHARERWLLQAAVAIGALIPVAAGISGIVCGLCIFHAHSALLGEADSHVRYLSGLLLAIGVGFWTTVTGIESHGERFRMLAVIVWVGGLARLVTLPQTGLPSKLTTLALVMELVVAPMLAMWRERIARHP